VSLEFLGIHRSRRRWNGDCVGEEGMTYRRRSWWLLAGLVVTGCTADVTGTPAGDRAADGVHTFGDVVLENVVWEDIGEDAMTIKESGRVEIRGGSATNGDDKVFQVNAPSTLVVTDFTASNAGKFVRQNGDTTFTVDLIIDGCDISNMAESIARTDSPTTTVTMTNTRYSAIGDALFIGFAAGNVTESGNTEY
jgi:pectate lyase C